MTRWGIPTGLKISAVLLSTIWASSVTYSQNAPSVVSTNPQMITLEKSRANQIRDYWTPERMKNAKEREALRPSSSGGSSNKLLNPNSTDGPGYFEGWDPKSGKIPPKSGSNVLQLSPSAITQSTSTSLTSFGSAPANPLDYSNYGPFQRWTWYGNYLTFPTSTIGKMFFKQDGIDYVCSGTVIGQNTVVTAGHCVKDGPGSWSTNILFCPSYYANGVNTVGCWAWTGWASTSSYWAVSGNLDGDYACFVTNTTGTTNANSVGISTGWLGLAWNWPASQMVFATGYPEASPFNGTNIIYTAATEWYQIVNSKFIGSDQTGGTSGGSWLLNLAHKAKEYTDVDGSNITDPGQNIGTPLVNGVNSHRRCLVNCNTPPTSSNGQYWSEMASPVFYSSGSDGSDTIDVMNSCFNNGG